MAALSVGRVSLNFVFCPETVPFTPPAPLEAFASHSRGGFVHTMGDGGDKGLTCGGKWAIVAINPGAEGIRR
jgi:hypothetical protein